MSSGDDGRGVPAYLLITFCISSVFYFLVIKSGQSGGGRGAYVVGLMWCPAVAALLTCRYLGRDVGSLGWKWGESRYQIWMSDLPGDWKQLRLGSCY